MFLSQKKKSFSRLRSNQRAVYRGSRRADIDTCSSLDWDKPLKNKGYIYNEREWTADGTEKN